MKNLFDLSGKVAVVTGGNGGIGIGMAEGLAQHGASVVIWGTNADKNAAALERLQKTGSRVAADQVDVADEAAVKKAMQNVVDAFGRVDFAVANAGISIRTPTVFDLTNEDLNRIEGVNQHGVLYTAREAARHMIARGEKNPDDMGGSILNVSSTSAIHGAARNAHYAMTKGAVVTLTRALAVEFARYRIRVNSVCPGWVRSDMTAASQQWDKFNEKVISRVPLKGWGDPEDFAGLAVYLASDASSWHTGDMMVLDGAYTIF